MVFIIIYFWTFFNNVLLFFCYKEVWYRSWYWNLLIYLTVLNNFGKLVVGIGMSTERISSYLLTSLMSTDSGLALAQQLPLPMREWTCATCSGRWPGTRLRYDQWSQWVGTASMTSHFILTALDIRSQW